MSGLGEIKYVTDDAVRKQVHEYLGNKTDKSDINIQQLKDVLKNFMGTPPTPPLRSETQIEAHIQKQKNAFRQFRSLIYTGIARNDEVEFKRIEANFYFFLDLYRKLLFQIKDKPLGEYILNDAAVNTLFTPETLDKMLQSAEKSAIQTATPLKAILGDLKESYYQTFTEANKDIEDLIKHWVPYRYRYYKVYQEDPVEIKAFKEKIEEYKERKKKDASEFDRMMVSLLSLLQQASVDKKIKESVVAAVNNIFLPHGFTLTQKGGTKENQLLPYFDDIKITFVPSEEMAKEFGGWKNPIASKEIENVPITFTATGEIELNTTDETIFKDKFTTNPVKTDIDKLKTSFRTIAKGLFDKFENFKLPNLGLGNLFSKKEKAPAYKPPATLFQDIQDLITSTQTNILTYLEKQATLSSTVEKEKATQKADSTVVQILPDIQLFLQDIFDNITTVASKYNPSVEDKKKIGLTVAQAALVPALHEELNSLKDQVYSLMATNTLTSRGVSGSVPGATTNLTGHLQGLLGTTLDNASAFMKGIMPGTSTKKESSPEVANIQAEVLEYLQSLTKNVEDVNRVEKGLIQTFVERLRPTGGLQQELSNIGDTLLDNILGAGKTFGSKELLPKAPSGPAPTFGGELSDLGNSLLHQIMGVQSSARTGKASSVDARGEGKNLGGEVGQIGDQLLDNLLGVQGNARRETAASQINVRGEGKNLGGEVGQIGDQLLDNLLGVQGNARKGPAASQVGTQRTGNALGGEVGQIGDQLLDNLLGVQGNARKGPAASQVGTQRTGNALGGEVGQIGDQLLDNLLGVQGNARKGPAASQVGTQRTGDALGGEVGQIGDQLLDNLLGVQGNARRGTGTTSTTSTEPGSLGGEMGQMGDALLQHLFGIKPDRKRDGSSSEQRTSSTVDSFGGELGSQGNALLEQILKIRTGSQRESGDGMSRNGSSSVSNALGGEVGNLSDELFKHIPINPPPQRPGTSLVPEEKKVYTIDELVHIADEMFTDKPKLPENYISDVIKYDILIGNTENRDYGKKLPDKPEDRCVIAAALLLKEGVAVEESRRKQEIQNILEKIPFSTAERDILIEKIQELKKVKTKQEETKVLTVIESVLQDSKVEKTKIISEFLPLIEKINIGGEEDTKEKLFAEKYYNYLHDSIIKNSSLEELKKLKESETLKTLLQQVEEANNAVPKLKDLVYSFYDKTIVEEGFGESFVLKVSETLTDLIISLIKKIKKEDRIIQKDTLWDGIDVVPIFEDVKIYIDENWKRFYKEIDKFEKWLYTFYGIVQKLYENPTMKTTIHYLEYITSNMTPVQLIHTVWENTLDEPKWLYDAYLLGLLFSEKITREVETAEERRREALDNLKHRRRSSSPVPPRSPTPPPTDIRSGRVEEADRRRRDSLLKDMEAEKQKKIQNQLDQISTTYETYQSDITNNRKDNNKSFAERIREELHIHNDYIRTINKVLEHLERELKNNPKKDDILSPIKINLIKAEHDHNDIEKCLGILRKENIREVAYKKDIANKKTNLDIIISKTNIYIDAIKAALQQSDSIPIHNSTIEALLKGELNNRKEELENGLAALKTKQREKGWKGGDWNEEEEGSSLSSIIGGQPPMAEKTQDTEEKITPVSGNITLDAVKADVENARKLNKKVAEVENEIDELRNTWETYKRTVPIKEFKDPRPRPLLEQLEREMNKPPTSNPTPATQVPANIPSENIFSAIEVEPPSKTKLYESTTLDKYSKHGVYNFPLTYEKGVPDSNEVQRLEKLKKERQIFYKNLETVINIMKENSRKTEGQSNITDRYDIVFKPLTTTFISRSHVKYTELPDNVKNKLTQDIITYYNNVHAYIVREKTQLLEKVENSTFDVTTKETLRYILNKSNFTQDDIISLQTHNIIEGTALRSKTTETAKVFNTTKAISELDITNNTDIVKYLKDELLKDSFLEAVDPPTKSSIDKVEKLYFKLSIPAIKEYIGELKRAYDEIKGYTPEDIKGIDDYFQKEAGKTLKTDITARIEKILKDYESVMKKYTEYAKKYAEVNPSIKTEILYKLEPVDISESDKIQLTSKLNEAKRIMFLDIDANVNNFRKNALALTTSTSMSGGARKHLQQGGEKTQIEISRDKVDVILSNDPKKDSSLYYSTGEVKQIGKRFYDIMARATDPAAALTLQGHDSLFNMLFNKYQESKRDPLKGEYVASMELSEALKANQLLPRDVLKITFQDKTIFLFTSLFLRLLSLSIVEFLIDRSKIVKLNTAVLAFLGIYTGMFYLFVLMVNVDTYKLRIIFNYVNFHVNSSVGIVYPAMLWIFGGAIYYIMWNINGGEGSSATNDEDRLRLKYKLQVLSMITWLFLSLMVILF